jgi:hypothetical protein
MPLVPLTLDLLKRSLSQLEESPCASRRVLSLGYPDVLASRSQIASIFGATIAELIDFRSDSAEVQRWHQAGPNGEALPEAGSLMRALGFELDVVDVFAARGGELIADLNEPLPESFRERYAVVLDFGTCEHCFNIAQAARNAAEAVALDGLVIHGSPLNMFNHGFYNLNPTWYYDFYETNGFVVEYLRLIENAVSAPRIGKVPPYEGFRGVPENSSLLVVARRTELKPVRWPMQRKYRNNPALRG